MNPPQRYLDALVTLAVEFGANVQPGQTVAVDTEIGHEVIARAVSEAAYARGAKFVDTWYFDPHVKRSRLRHADPETLTFVPPWLGDRMLTLGEMHGAHIWLYGETEPELMQDVDPALLGLDILPRRVESSIVVADKRINWTVIPIVTPAWARLVYPDLSSEAAHEALWDAVAHVCRLAEPDPVAAWEARMAQLKEGASRLGALELDAVTFVGPGTDLTVGLLPGSGWIYAETETDWGLRHHPNLPTEELFTTPDPTRAEGVVSATKPLLLPGAAPITGLRVWFEGGRAVRFEADEGVELLRTMTARDDGGCRLGEVALVDGESRVGQTGTVFYNSLLDENAACHIAFGDGYADAVEGQESLGRMNESRIHVDFMIGSNDVEVTGVTRDGVEVPLLRGGVWQTL